MLNKDYESIIEKLVDWIKNKINQASARGAVVGLSGGIDSSVTAVLCNKAFPENTLGLILPCESNSLDKKDARLLAENFSLEYKVIDLNKTYQTLTNILPENEKIATANIKPRLRMTALYYIANLNNYLVVGTGNKSELELGYFTKYGDGGVDIEPLGNLVKTEVRKIAKLLAIPEKIINKPPSAGLWENQKDEKELGLSYEKIDRYLLEEKGSKNTKQKIDKLKQNNKHKLTPPMIPDF